jgi:hypothetical protein
MAMGTIAIRVLLYLAGPDREAIARYLKSIPAVTNKIE